MNALFACIFSLNNKKHFHLAGLSGSRCIPEQFEPGSPARSHGFINNSHARSCPCHKRPGESFFFNLIFPYHAPLMNPSLNCSKPDTVVLKSLTQLAVMLWCVSIHPYTEFNSWSRRVSLRTQHHNCFPSLLFWLNALGDIILIRAINWKNPDTMTHPYTHRIRVQRVALYNTAH